METGSSTCITYRNKTFLPSLINDHRRFLVSPAVSSVVSGRPDMVFGLGKDRVRNSTDTSNITKGVTSSEINLVGKDTENNLENKIPVNPEAPKPVDRIVDSSTENINVMSTNTELAALKAEIILQGGVDSDMYKEPEHSFLKATSEDTMSEVNDSVSQYVPKPDGSESKENSFAKLTESHKQMYLTETLEDDDERKWNEALQKHQDAGTVPPETGNNLGAGDSSPKPAAKPTQGSSHVSLPSSAGAKSSYWEKGRQFKRVPAKLIRLASLSARNTSDSSTRRSKFYSPPKSNSKVLSLEDAINSRPPLRFDMEGPTPCTYSPRNKPLKEKNSPSWSFGQKCYIEKTGGARTSWGKMWFQTPHVWQNKVDFNAEGEWPSPVHYPQPTVTQSPAFTIGTKKTQSLKIGIENMPSPVDYDIQIADRQTHPRQPSYTHQFRREGTILWGVIEPTPGPGTYFPSSPRSRNLHRSHTITGIRGQQSHTHLTQ